MMADDDGPQLHELSDSELPRLTVDVGVRLGGGSTGRVYLATYDSAPCALKLLHPVKARREHEVQHFIKEALLISQLQHRYQVSCHVASIDMPLHRCLSCRNIVPIIAICPVPPAFSGLPTRRFTWGMLLEFMEVGGKACMHACMGNAFHETQLTVALALLISFLLLSVALNREEA